MRSEPDSYSYSNSLWRGGLSFTHTYSDANTYSYCEPYGTSKPESYTEPFAFRERRRWRGVDCWTTRGFRHFSI